MVKGERKCHRQAGSKSDPISLVVSDFNYFTMVICTKTIVSTLCAFS